MDSYTKHDVQAVLNALKLDHELRTVTDIHITVTEITVTRRIYRDGHVLLSGYAAPKLAEHVERIPIIRT